MNLVGKIFVFLILVASTVFMTMALMVFATHRNYQELVEGSRSMGGTTDGYKKQLEDDYKERTKLVAQIDLLKTAAELENRNHAEQLAKAETELNILRDRNVKLDADAKGLQVRLETATTALKAAQDNLTALRHRGGQAPRRHPHGQSGDRRTIEKGHQPGRPSCTSPKANRAT